MVDDQKLLEMVIAEFEALTRIPRPSGHERAVSDYLKKRFEELGCTVHQDESLNIIADLPASSGCETAPRTILQGHMDMVCVAEEGTVYDPLKDAIKLRRTEKFLMAEGTSLGGDDGIGVAEILAAFRCCKEHGPLRAIITVDEEQGMSGARNLAERYLMDADFLINCDSEDYHVLTVGSAGSVNLDFERKLTRRAVHGTAWRIEVRGLHGGHSGERIGDGRGNAIRVLALALISLSARGTIGLVDFTGGAARNAIPSTASAVICTELTEHEIQSVLASEKRRFDAIYGVADPNMSLACMPTEALYDAVSAEDLHAILALLALLRTGVYEMSRLHAGKVETSANLGVVRMDKEAVRVQFFPRSSVNEQLDETIIYAQTAAQCTGFILHMGAPSPAWRENEKSTLARIICEVYAQHNNGAQMIVESIHAGLECSWHSAKNPALDMVSIGVTTRDIHSPKERVEIAAIVPEAYLIMETLYRIGSSKGDDIRG